MTEKRMKERMRSFKKVIGDFVTVYLRTASGSGVDSTAGYLVGVDSNFIYLGQDPKLPAYEILIDIEDVTILKIGIDIMSSPMFDHIDDNGIGH